MANDICIENPAGYADLPVAALERLVEWILESEQRPSWAITVVFVDDSYITDLNSRFFQKSTTTDVLSFNLSESDAREGEVYISIDTAKRNSDYYSVTLENEIYRLVAHGVYHLLDYDDTTDEEKHQMTILENKALAFIYSLVKLQNFGK